MTDLLVGLGRAAWDPFWVPVLAWTGLAAAVLAALRWLPAQEVFIRRDLHVALLVSLPAGLAAARLLPALPGFAGAWLRLFGRSASAVAASPSAGTAPPSAWIEAAQGPIAAQTVDPALWIGAATLASAVASAVGLALLVAAVLRVRAAARGATAHGIERSAGGRTIRVLWSARAPVPFSFGMLRPRIVLPVGIREDRDIVVVHERLHHEHGDVGRLWAVNLVRAAFFFHPLAHRIAGRIALCMEAACDRGTLERTGIGAAEYGRVLLRAVPQEAHRGLWAAALPIGRGHRELRSRIEAMRLAPLPARRGRSARAGSRAAFLLSALLVAGAGMVSLEPTPRTTALPAEPTPRTAALQAEPTPRTAALPAESPPAAVAPGRVALPRASIVGRVTRVGTGEPLPGASVAIPSRLLGSVTGPDGRYVIDGVPAGPHRVRMSLIGFVLESRLVEVPADGEVTVDFLAEPETRPPPPAPPPLVPQAQIPPAQAPPAQAPPLPVPAPPPSGDDAEVYVIVEQMPCLLRPDGACDPDDPAAGPAELLKKVVYPDIAIRAGIQGRVHVQFVVDEQGSVRDAVVLSGIGAGCDEEALRVVREARFAPGRQRGRAVRVRMTLPIQFRLSGGG